MLFRSVYYIAAVPAEFSKEIPAAENDLADYYKNNTELFKEPLSLNMEYVALDDQLKAKNAVGLIKKNDGLEKIAKEYSVSVKETGFFAQTDPIPGIGWSPAISEMVAKLKVGQYANPIVMDKKYYFMRLKDRKEPNIPQFEKIKSKVKDAFIKERSEKMAKERIDEALKSTKDPNAKADFNAIAKKLGLKTGATDLFQFDSYIEGIGASNKLWLTGEKLKPEETSDIIEMPSGSYIVKVKQSLDIDDKKFSEEKEEFSQKLLSQKKQEAFSKFLEGLRRKAQ